MSHLGNGQPYEDPEERFAPTLPNSIEIGRSASGKLTVTVKVRSSDPAEMARQAQLVFDDVCRRYELPVPSTPVTDLSDALALVGGGGEPDDF